MIPAAIQALLPQQPGEENRIGHSGAQVVMYEDCVLKVQPDTGNAANEGIMLRFLKGGCPCRRCWRRRCRVECAIC